MFYIFLAAQADDGDVTVLHKRSLSFRQPSVTNRQQQQPKHKRDISGPFVPPPPPPGSNSGRYLSPDSPTDGTAAADDNISTSLQKKKIFGSRENLINKSFRKMAGQLRTKVRKKRDMNSYSCIKLYYQIQIETRGKF